MDGFSPSYDSTSSKCNPAIANSPTVKATDRAVTTICNYFIVFLWLGIILFLIFDFRKLDAYKLIFVITFIGGFLFHLVWEAKGQYTIIYAYLMIPYMLRGYQLLLRRVCNISLGGQNA